MKGFLEIFKELWKYKDDIRQVISIVETVAKHVKNLIEDLQDDGQLNGSVGKK